MSENRTEKPNYNNPTYNQQYDNGNKQYENTFGGPTYLPANYDYDRKYTNSFYEEDDSSASGSFLFGALVGGVIGAAAALFLAPKSGSEMREGFSEQATHLKDKGIEISSVAKGKATEFTAVAKEKTGELSKSLQEQSEQLVDKVKSMKSKTSVPMDDGTASSEGEEAIEYIDQATAKLEDANNGVEEETMTTTAAALKKAVEEVTDSKDDSSLDKQATGNSNVSYDNSENMGKDKMTNQNYVSDINEKQ